MIERWPFVDTCARAARQPGCWTVWVGGTDDDVCGGDLDLDPGISALDLHASSATVSLDFAIMKVFNFLPALQESSARAISHPVWAAQPFATSRDLLRQRNAVTRASDEA